MNVESCKRDSGDSIDAYFRGLNDAWELAKKIILAPEYGGLYSYELLEAFNESHSYNVIKDINVIKALTMYNGWLEKKTKEKSLEEMDKEELIKLVKEKEQELEKYKENYVIKIPFDLKTFNKHEDIFGDLFSW